MNPLGRARRKIRPGTFALALILCGSTSILAQNPSDSFSKRLEQAARAAAGPLRGMAEPATPGDPRGDSATNTAPDRAPATRAPAPAPRAPGQPAAKTARPSEPQEKLETFSLEASVVLGDGRTVRGRLHFRAPEKVVITHKRDDIQYRKTIRIQNIESVEITQWKGEPVRKNRKGEWIYRFAPRASTLTLKSGLVLQENARLLPYFERLTIRNSNGEVTLFSFWMDLLKADGSWYTGITGPTNGLRRTGHKDVIQRIEFGLAENHD